MELDTQTVRRGNLYLQMFVKFDSVLGGQKKLAELTGMKPAYISHMLKGRRPITERSAQLIEEKLKLAKGELSEPIEGIDYVSMEARRISEDGLSAGDAQKMLIEVKHSKGRDWEHQIAQGIVDRMGTRVLVRHPVDHGTDYQPDFILTRHPSIREQVEKGAPPRPNIEAMTFKNAHDSDTLMIEMIEAVCAALENAGVQTMAPRKLASVISLLMRTTKPGEPFDAKIIAGIAALV